MIQLDNTMSSLLLPWYAAKHRDLPWRRDQEPYHVWLSEIMLQQTRVEAVLGYYRRFLEALPDLPSLAACPDDRLYKLWEGLGYYARARNLRKAAQQVMERHGGQFPEQYDQVRALAGIGDYTAAAICSICFDLPAPAVDGNVLRVVTRLAACRSDILRAETKREVTAALAEVYPVGCRGEFNQAMMELGAMVCGPNREPDCVSCPLSTLCQSRAGGLWREIPCRAAKKPRKQAERTVLLLRCGGLYAVNRRPARGLLAGMWEYPNVEGLLSAQAALSLAADWGCRPAAILRMAEKKHIFTHIQWQMRGYFLDCQAAPPPLTWVKAETLEKELSLPTAFRQFTEEWAALRPE